jgi:RNA polymerase sigma-70 factor, ECF subfamily
MNLEEDIVRRYAPLVWATVFRLLNHHADASDCFQQTFIAALEMGRKEKIRTWEGMLKRIAITKALDTLRHRIRQRKRLAPDAAGDHLPAPGGNTHDHAERHELGHHLRQALAKLPPPQAEAFCMRHLSDMSYEEIAAELAMKPNAVGVMLHRTKSRLALLLGETHALRNEVNYGL